MNIKFIPTILLLASFLLLFSACGVSKIKSDSKPITHEKWDSLVSKHVTEKGSVDYKGFIQDSTQLNSYLTLLKNNHPNDKNWSKDEQLAYWLNAYNAFTVKLIMDHYPVKSIKDIKNGVPFVNTVWDIKFIKIEGQEYDLNNIEHGIIRKYYDEPRIHFACNCASISCPRLRNEAYQASKLDAQLTDQAKYFLTNEVKNKIDPQNPKVSKLFTWYSGDFKKGGKSVIDFINQYSEVKINENAELEYLDYNWSLNE